MIKYKFIEKFKQIWNKALDMVKYASVEFEKVAYVGWANERLILSAKYTIGRHEYSDTLFIYEGKFNDGVFHFKEAFLSGCISKKDYELVRNCIITESIIWCDNLGLPGIKKLSSEEWNG